MKFKTKLKQYFLLSVFLSIGSLVNVSCFLFGGGGDDPDPTPPTLELNPTAINFPMSQGATEELKIKTSDDAQWEVNDNECSGWLSVSIKSGKGSMSITLTTKNENKGAAYNCELEVVAKNEAGTVSQKVRISRDGIPDFSENFARVAEKIDLSYGMACAIEHGNASSYFLYNIYPESEFSSLRGNDEKIVQEATKNETKWKRINIPSSGGVEIISNDCRPATDYVFVTVSYKNDGTLGQILTESFSTKDASENNQPRVTVTPKKKTIEEVHDSNNGPWYKWDTNSDGKSTFYITYACASDKLVETMLTHNDIYGVIDNTIGISLAWNIFMESKKDNLANAREVSFNKDNSGGREMLFGKARYNSTQWLEYRSTDKYLQVVTWAFKEDDFNSYSGVVSDVLYHVDDGELREIETPIEYYLNVAPATLSFGPVPSDSEISIDSNDSWTVTSDKNWCKINAETGTGKKSITVTVERNTESTERKATITIKGNNSPPVSVVVNQEPYTLSVTPTEAINFSANSSNSIINITSNDNWTATSDETSWCVVSPSNGSGDGTITVTAKENKASSVRSAKVIIKGEHSGMTYTVSVVQDGVKYDLTVDPTSLQFESAGSANNINVTSNDNWTATSNATSWCTVSPSSGSGNGTVKVTVKENTANSARSATITIKGEHSGKTFTVSVTQKGKSGFDINGYGSDTELDPTAYTLSVETSSLQLEAEGTTKNISLSGNDDWTATSNATSWCTVSPSSGTAPGTIKVTATKNTQSSQRTATITIKGSKSGKEFTVAVLQDGVKYDLSVNPSSLQFESASSANNINVTSNDNWTVTSNATSWCTVSPSSGSGNGTVKVTVKENTANSARSATVTIKGEHSGKTFTISVTQKGKSGFDLNGYGSDTELDPTVYTLSVETSSLQFEAAGTTKNINVSGNDEWTATSNATSWCTVSQSGTAPGTIKVTATKNTQSSQRTATITIKGSKSGKTFTVSISQGFYSLSVSPGTLQFESASSSGNISITSNSDWTATSNATSWCTVSPSSGSGNGTVKVILKENTANSVRTATVTIKDTNSGKTHTVSVTQKGKSGFGINEYGSDTGLDGTGITYTLSVGTSSLQFEAAGTTKSISVSGNDSWTATSNATSWCTVSPSSGTAPGTIKITATKNTQSSQRTATITVKGSKSGKTFTISVTQAAGGSTGFGKNEYGSDVEL